MMNNLLVNDLLEMEPVENLSRNWMRPWRGELAQSAPQIKVDVSELDGSYKVKAEIPGVKKEDIDVRIDGDQVTISAEVKKENQEKKDGRVLRSECRYGYASRSFSLDREFDEAKSTAKYENGILELTLPKKTGSTTKRLAIS
jgi:HSP20 family protein